MRRALEAVMQWFRKQQASFRMHCGLVLKRPPFNPSSSIRRRAFNVTHISSRFSTSISHCISSRQNIYLWSRKYPTKYAVVENTLIFQGIAENGAPSVTFPAGEQEDVRRALEAFIPLLHVNFTLHFLPPFQCHLKTVLHIFRRDRFINPFRIVFQKTIHMISLAMELFPGKACRDV